MGRVMQNVAIFKVNVAGVASLFLFYSQRISVPCKQIILFSLILYNVYNCIKKVGMKFAF